MKRYLIAASLAMMAIVGKAGADETYPEHVDVTIMSTHETESGHACIVKYQLDNQTKSHLYKVVIVSSINEKSVYLTVDEIRANSYGFMRNGTVQAKCSEFINALHGKQIIQNKDQNMLVFGVERCVLELVKEDDCVKMIKLYDKSQPLASH